MYEFHYKYIKSKFDTKFLFTDTGSLVDEIKMFMKIFMRTKNCSILMITH